jgi:protein-S-isoprenylcysteine O-methyltransferase Ste14
MALGLFVPAGTIFYGRGWIFLGVFFAATIAITVYLMKNDPALLERRMKARLGSEKEFSQRMIQALATILFFAIFVLSALDYRLRPLAVPASVVVVGDTLVALGFFIVFLVFRENSFASVVIEIAPGQKVISSGPYALVRHPMYSGALVMLLGVPLALGSWRGLWVLVPTALALKWRAVEEEKFLAQNLPGYAAYRAKIRYRLLPLIW